MDISCLARRSAFDVLLARFNPRLSGGDHKSIQVQFNETHQYRSKKGDKMHTNKMTNLMKDKKVILSTLWIFALLNYIYADIFTLFFNPEALTMKMSQGSVLAFAVLMETAIVMVLLSRVLKYGANRWASIIAGIIHTALVSWTLFGETPLPFYILFASIEIACTLFIVWYAWRWRQPEF
jgi:hypothetical protein